MNWYKLSQRKDITKQYPLYEDIGHYEDQSQYENTNKEIALWMSSLDGSNFYRKDLEGTNDVYEHVGLAYDTGFDLGAGSIQGRYDRDKNVVSLHYDPRIATMEYLPNRLIDRLRKEFGGNITILDYSRGSPQVVV